MNTKIEMLKMDDFHQNFFGKLQDGDCLLDVRTADEFDAGHMPGAMNQSHESVMHVFDELKQYKRVFIYCRRGARAQTAAKILAEKNCSSTLYCIHDAGMDYWNSKGWPVKY